ncbi:hypothetical protein BESB_053110 [Besnoitia besnoiti]|uniref:Uncharacterized protein n=1 Tax=Besnoitia besnoiti TaxID=94643 RepID=A0A2A9MJT6_BESBE|nr:hypothetical protein BESB_053110 [Besnoitia besnoiti]PFH35660.1 hypothetical protein BESB_053110 [Besnoitia besnoiti]
MLRVSLREVEETASRLAPKRESEGEDALEGGCETDEGKEVQQSDKGDASERPGSRRGESEPDRSVFFDRSALLGGDAARDPKKLKEPFAAADEAEDVREDREAAGGDRRKPGECGADECQT